MKLALQQICSILILESVLVSPIQAQVDPFLNFFKTSQLDAQSSADERIVSACVRLDGRCLFKIVDRRSEIRERVNEIEGRLNDISQNYFNSDKARIKVYKQKSSNLPNLVVSVNHSRIRLLTVTYLDAELNRLTPDAKADKLIEKIESGLKRAKEERSTNFLVYQSLIASSIFIGMLLSYKILNNKENKLRQAKEQVKPSANTPTQPISTQLFERQKWHIREVKYRLIQLLKIGIFIGGSLLILGLFPYTRIGQVLLIGILRIPLRVILVGLITYLGIRLSYALIAKLNSTLAEHYLWIPESNQRLQLRLKTITVVTRSIITIIGIAVGSLVALSVIGVNITPILAAVGILSVGVSLASQNLIKDAINGFLIILEDQYAVGDVIEVGSVSGLVENINLRITQLRDSQGRLITIPNSEIKIVANLSSHWSRADLAIPVAYHVDIDKALILIRQVAQEISEDAEWQANIIEEPQVLGVDHFDDRGVIIRVWIKTAPLKQWEVSREFRRRVKIAFDEANISIFVPQQQILFQDMSEKK